MCGAGTLKTTVLGGQAKLFVLLPLLLPVPAQGLGVPAQGSGVLMAPQEEQGKPLTAFQAKEADGLLIIHGVQAAPWLAHAASGFASKKWHFFLTQAPPGFSYQRLSVPLTVCVLLCG